MNTAHINAEPDAGHYTGVATIGEAIEYGWHKFWAHWTLLVGLGLFYAALIAVDTMIGLLLEERVGTGVSIGWEIATAIFFGYIYLGYIRICLNLMDGTPTGFADLFSQYDKIIPWFVASILYFAATGLGFVLLILPGIYLLVRLFFYDYLIIDRGAGILECLSESWRITAGFTNTMRLLGLLVLLILINLLGALACGVGLLLTWPITFLATLAFYRSHLHTAA